MTLSLYSSILLAVAVSGTTSILRTARELSAFLMSGTKGAARFELRATVCAPPVGDGATLSVPISDSSGFSLIRTRQPAVSRMPNAGDVLQLSGTLNLSTPHDVTTSLDRFDCVGTDPQPTPKSRTIRDILSGARDWQSARISGLVRDVLPSETNDGWTFLTLSDGRDILTVAAPLNGTPLSAFAALIGRDVSIDGYGCPRDGSLRLYQGRIFHCPGLSAIRAIADAPTDPFAAPRIEAIRFRSPTEIAAMGRICALGRVILSWGTRDALIKTADGDFVHALCDEANPPPRGASVEIAGFPVSDLFHISLLHARWRTTAPVAVSEGKEREIDLAQLPTARRNHLSTLATLHGARIRFAATVRSLPDRALRPQTLFVEDGDCIVPVDVSSAPHALADVTPGCRLRIRATCVLETKDGGANIAFPQIQGFTAVVNADEDIEILAHPPWWTVKHALALLGIALVLFVAILVRLQVRRAQAELKTAERTRLAVELHDSLSQSLTGAFMELQTAENAYDGANPQVKRHLAFAAKILKSCREELKNCLWDLRSETLEEPSLQKMIVKTLQPDIADAQLAVRFPVAHEKLADNIVHALLRIIRELAVNARRHGQAVHIRVAGCLDGQRLRCAVSDDGCGFDPKSVPGVLQGHFGLQGIRERLEELRGDLTIQSKPGEGTRVCLSIPLPTRGEKRCKRQKC